VATLKVERNAGSSVGQVITKPRSIFAFGSLLFSSPGSRQFLKRFPNRVLVALYLPEPLKPDATLNSLLYCPRVARQIGYAPRRQTTVYARPKFKQALSLRNKAMGLAIASRPRCLSMKRFQKANQILEGIGTIGRIRVLRNAVRPKSGFMYPSP